MTSSGAAPATHTPLALLFGQDSPEEGLQRLWDGEAAHGVRAALSRIEPVVRKAATVEITTAAAELLQTNLVDMLVAGWRKHEDLLAAARRTLDSPGTTELVELAKHRVTCAEHPYVDLLVDGTKLTTIHLELSVVFDVHVLVAAVRTARIVALHSGSTDITATLAVEDVDVASRGEHVDLPLIIPLGNGIPLLANTDA